MKDYLYNTSKIYTKFEEEFLRIYYSHLNLIYFPSSLIFKVLNLLSFKCFITYFCGILDNLLAKSLFFFIYSSKF